MHVYVYVYDIASSPWDDEPNIFAGKRGKNSVHPFPNPPLCIFVIGLKVHFVILKYYVKGPYHHILLLHG